MQVKGRRQDLGKHGSDGSWERHRRFVAELLARPAVPAAALAEPPQELRVVELAAAYWESTQGYSRNGPGGTPPGCFSVARHQRRKPWAHLMQVGVTWCAKPRATNVAAVITLTSHLWELQRPGESK